MEEVEKGSLSPVHPNFSPNRREVPRQPHSGLRLLSARTLPLLLLPSSTSGVKTGTVRVAQTQPHAHLEPEGRDWTHSGHTPEDAQTRRAPGGVEAGLPVLPQAKAGWEG